MFSEVPCQWTVSWQSSDIAQLFKNSIFIYKHDKVLNTEDTFPRGLSRNSYKVEKYLGSHPAVKPYIHKVKHYKQICPTLSTLSSSEVALDFVHCPKQKYSLSASHRRSLNVALTLCCRVIVIVMIYFFQFDKAKLMGLVWIQSPDVLLNNIK